MEKLLNKLIDKGWTKKAHHLQGLPKKPFVRRVKDSIHGVEFYYYEWWDNEAKLVKIYSLRDLVSKSSGLWQFVCENRMVGRGDRITKRKKVKDTDSWSGEEVIYYSVIGSYNETDYEYRLIETALTDEDKLEQFLLENIKVE